MWSTSLYKLCVLKTASLLKDCYWPLYSHTTECFASENLFSFFPSDVIEELLLAVIQITPSKTLSVKELYPMLSSGRIKRFRLEDVLLQTEEFINILTTLSVYGKHLEYLVLRKIYCVDYYKKLQESKKLSVQSSSVECLLSLSPNLKHIVIDIKFDLKVIQKLKLLEKLELCFPPENKLYDLILKVDGSFLSNSSVTHISIFEDYQNKIPVEEIAFLLKYFKELICLEINIAKALEYLHEKDIFCGLLTVKYKLQKCILGSAFVNSNEGVASAVAIHIATVTCPCIRELDVLLNDNQAITTLRGFLNLNSLLIQWDDVIPCDFRLGLQFLLESIGNKLSTFYAINFKNIDFSIIGALCSCLKFFKIEYDNEVSSSEYSPDYFQYLESLHIESIGDIGTSEASLILLLSNCKNLSSVYLSNIPNLTDEVLMKLLSKNPFLCLKDVTLIQCSISENGLAHLIKSCKTLEFLNFNSSLISFEVAVAIVHSINPLIIITTENL